LVRAGFGALITVAVKRTIFSSVTLGSSEKQPDVSENYIASIFTMEK
jgi:hypothetical protein